jgi:ubiquinone biosynthesis protein COQ9
VPSDDDLKAAVLAAALVRAPLEGFSPAMLARALADVGGAAAHFPHGCASVIEYWSASVDAAMTANLVAADLNAMKVRQRIRTAVLTRLALIASHKVAARQAAVFLALPHHAPLAVRLLTRTADAMWRAVGDVSTDFNWYSKRAILAGVYAATEIAWFGDDTPDGCGTIAFLDARIENVMQYEKLKAKLRPTCRPTRTSSQ